VTSCASPLESSGEHMFAMNPNLRGTISEMAIALEAV
jgi:hypothetical protein